jgi:hypothetical protein
MTAPGILIEKFENVLIRKCQRPARIAFLSNHDLRFQIFKFPNFQMLIVLLLTQIPTFAFPKADVVKLADTPDLGSGAARLGGSSPSIRTYLQPAFKAAVF